MTKHRTLRYGEPVPESFFNAWQEFISTAAPNMTLSVVPANPPVAVQIVAGPDNAQVGIGINGLWRWITATVSATVGPAAATYDIFVTATPNSFAVNLTPPPPETDNTDYTFGLVARPSGTTPTQPQWRKVGEAVFNGTRITSIRQMIGQVDASETFNAGDLKAALVASPPAGWLRCDGALYTVQDYAELFGAIGYAYGGAGASFNVPDLRDTFLMGAGASLLGARGGAAAITLNGNQIPTHAHGINFMSQGEDRDHQHLVPGMTTDGDYPDHGHWGNPSQSSYHAVLFYRDGLGVGAWNAPGWGWSASGGATARHTHNTPAAWTTARNQGHLHQVVGSTQNAGADGSHENRPPFLAANIFIKT